MNTGHEGSLSTCHANSPRDLLVRLETMVMMSELGLPAVPIRQQIAAALDLIVHTTRFSDGRRRVTSVTEVRGLTRSGLDLAEAFRFVRGGTTRSGAIKGRFEAVEEPRCAERLRAAGIEP